MKTKRALLIAKVNFILNTIYCVYNFVLGVASGSFWFLASGAYYMVLAVMRFGALALNRREADSWFMMRFSGVMLLVMSWVLSAVAYFSLKQGMAQSYHEIVMITIACYTFTKITLAIIKVIKAKCENSPVLTTIRHISLADAAVSVYTLQQSMLVSFPGMNEGEIFLMNALTGGGMCLFVCVLGVFMIVKKGNKNGKIKNSKSERKN